MRISNEWLGYYYGALYQTAAITGMEALLPFWKAIVARECGRSYLSMEHFDGCWMSSAFKWDSLLRMGLNPGGRMNRLYTSNIYHLHGIRPKNMLNRKII